MTDFTRLEVSRRRPGVAQITMSRAELFNAFDEVMIGELEDAFAQLVDDDSVRAIIVTGAGRAFWRDRTSTASVVDIYLLRHPGQLALTAAQLAVRHMLSAYLVALILDQN